MDSQDQPGSSTRWAGPGSSAFRAPRRSGGRRALGVITAILAVLVAAIAVNAVVLSRQRWAGRIVVIDTSAVAADATLGGQARLSTEPVIGQALQTLVAVAVSKNIAAQGFAPGFDLARAFAHPDQPLDDIKAMTYTAYTQEMAAFGPFVTAEPMRRRLTALHKPLLVIFGNRDQIAVGEKHDLRLYRTVPGAVVRTIAGAGHSPQVEAPRPTAALILAFIGQAR